MAMDSRGQALKANAVVFLVLTSLALLLRIWVRIKTTKRFWVDDWLLLVAVALFNTFAGLYLIALYWGLALSVKDPNILSGKNALQAWFYGDLFYTLCSVTIKFAAATQILRHITRPWQKRLVCGFTAIHVAVNIFMIFALVFRCKPVNWFWQRMMYNPHRANNPALGHCYSRITRRSMHAQSIFGALVDFVFATLPLFIMKDLDLKRTQRISLWIVVILAELSGVAMIARVPAIMNLHFRRGFPFTSIPFGILNTIESGLAIIALCVASLSPLLPSPVLERERQTFARWDMESQSALRGIPLDSGMGNTTLVESNGNALTDKTRTPFKTKAKSRKTMESTDTLVMERWNDLGILKTTDVVTTHSQENLGKIQEPASSLKR